MYNEWKRWHGSYVEYHDLHVAWQILDPASKPFPTNIQKDIDKILDPRVLLEAGFNIDGALYRAIIKHVCEEREDNVTLTSLYPPLFPQTWRNAQIMMRARHKISMIFGTWNIRI